MNESRAYFEMLVKNTPANWRGNIIDVLDTAEICVSWFRAMGIEPSSDAVVHMTDAILRREKKLSK